MSRVRGRRLAASKPSPMLLSRVVARPSLNPFRGLIRNHTDKRRGSHGRASLNGGEPAQATGVAFTLPGSAYTVVGDGE